MNEVGAGNLDFIRSMIRTSRHRVILSPRLEEIFDNDMDTFKEIIRKIKSYNAWNPANDPNGDHDFGKIQVDGNEYYFIVRLYDASWVYPYDPETMDADGIYRTLTIIDAREWQ